MKKISILLAFVVLFQFFVSAKKISWVYAEPFYGDRSFEPKLISTFCTEYKTSPIERAHNIELASKKLDGVFIEVGGEFSFNKTVGERSEKNGFLSSNVIIDKKFTQGVGGGVCQVSTTLYNVVLLAGLKVTECHPHSLSVAYVYPSFDAMVSYNYADLRFINITKHPIYIKTFCKDKTLTISIYGAKQRYTYVRKYEITDVLPIDKQEIIVDELNEYNLSTDEVKYLSYGKDGFKSKGYLLVYDGKKLVDKKLIRTDSYASMPKVIVVPKDSDFLDTQTDF
jgi:hypothetical protein